MAIVKMNPQAVRELKFHMGERITDLRELLQKIITSKNKLIPGAFKCQAATEYGTHLDEIETILFNEYINDLVDFINKLDQEIAQFEETGADLGY